VVSSGSSAAVVVEAGDGSGKEKEKGVNALRERLKAAAATKR
jgi:hypothetical protein